MTYAKLKTRLFQVTTLAIGLMWLSAAAIAQDGNAADDKQIDDEKIVIAIENELMHAKAVNANSIDVKVNQGIATLSGDVKTILTKDRAVRIAQMTKGVRSVVDQVKVKNGNRSDDEIRINVVSALAKDPATDSYEMTISASNGNVTLGGTVQSYAERELATTVAKTVRGVTDVTNNMTVNYTTDRPDSEIKAEIEQRLKWDVRLDDEMITVNVKDGNVTLSGSVGSSFEKSIARGDAWSSGVRSVEDENLTVAWWSRDDMQRNTAWESLKNEEIEDAVKKAFLYDPRVYSFNPNVSADNGVVTLTGVVDNLKAKRAAAQDAKNTVGVWRVKNYLKVRPVAERTDEEIRMDIASAFLRDYYVNRYDATLYVNNGEVSLYGDVDSYYEKAHAEDLAAKVNGVTDVNNYLSVSYDYPLTGHYHYWYDWSPTLYDFDYDYDYETVRTKPDSEIKEEIESELWWSPWVSYGEVAVTVDDGVATLSGTVDSWNERESAEENAIEGGAIKVVNKLDVDYSN